MCVSLFRLQLEKYAFLSKSCFFANTHFCRQSDFVANTRFWTQIFTQISVPKNDG